MADFEAPKGGSGADLSAIEARLAAIKASVSQLESRLAADVSAESRGAGTGRRATERAVRDDLRSTEGGAGEGRALDDNTSKLDSNTRARQRRIKSFEDEVSAAQKAQRLETGFEYAPPLQQGAGTAAKKSTLLAEAGGVSTADEAAMRRQAQAKALLADLDGRMVLEQQAVNSSLDQDIQKRSLASQGLRKHGALTTEFISAAARGNVTMKEMGYQVGATIGKFAGWTAASVAVFAAVGAIQQLGKGALDSSSQVQILSNYVSNLNTDKAQEQLRSLSQEFNLPVDQVGEAFQGMGKIFHDQNQAFEATKAALYGVKVGELSAADSTKYLTSVVNGFHLQGDQLTSVLDKVNQAQNKYGVSIKDTIAGTAQAAGAWKAAGGDLDHLIALIVTGEKVTGRSGIQIGTALQRVPSLIQKPSNQAALKGFGIDPTEDPEKILAEAAKKVQSGQVKGKDVNALAIALSTPQLAPRISPILQNTNLYNQVFKSIAGDAAKGSSQQELENRLKSVGERVKALGVNLEAVGVELARLGAFDALGGLLIGLNLTLKLVTDVLSLVNNLPKGFRESLVVVAELYGVLRLIRRFRPPDLNPQTGEVSNTGFFRQNPEKYQRSVLQEASRNQVTFYQDRQEQLANRLPVERDQAANAVARRNAVAETERVAALEGDAGALQRLTAAERAATDSLARAMATEAELTAVEARLVAAREAQTLVATSNLKAEYAQGRGAAQVGREAGIYSAPGTNERPTPDRPVPVPGGANRAAVAVEEAEQGGAALATEAEQVATAQTRFSGVTGRVEAGAMSLVGGMSTTTGKLGALKGVMGRLGNSAMSLAGSLRGMLLSDPILGVTAAVIGGEALKAHFEAEGKKWDALGNGPQNETQQNDLLGPLANASAAQRKAAFDKSKRQMTELRALGMDPSHEAEAQQAALAQAVMQDNQRAKDMPVQGLFTSQIRVEASKAADDYKHGRTTLSGAQDAIQKALKEVDLSSSALPLRKAARQDLLQQLAALGPGKGQSLKDIYAALDEKSFKQRLDDSLTTVQALGATTESLHEPAAALAAALKAGGKHPTGDDAKKIKDARDAMKALLSELDTEYQDAVKLADGDSGAETAAFEKAKRQIKQTKGGKQAKIAMQQLISEALGTVTKDLTDSLTLAGGDQAAVNAAFARARAGVRKTGNGRQQQLALKQIADQQYQSEATRIDSIAGLTEAQQQSNPIAVVTTKLRALGQKIADAIRAYGKDSNQVRDLIAQQYALYRERADDKLSLVDANTAVASALTGTHDPVGTARAALAGAQNHYNTMVQSGQYSQAELRQAQANIISARNALNDSITTQANALQDSILTLRLSQTDDPVKQAKIKVDQAKAALSQATNQAERNNALAGINTARRDYAKSIQQSRYDDIEFEASIGKMTVAAEITALQNLEKTIKGNKDLKRQIQQRVYALKQQVNQDGSSLDLNLDSLTLPTTYEIRRAVTGRAASGSNVTVHNNPTVQVTVNDPGAADAVYKAIEDATSTSVRSAVRAGGG